MSERPSTAVTANRLVWMHSFESGASFARLNPRPSSGVNADDEVSVAATIYLLFLNCQYRYIAHARRLALQLALATRKPRTRHP